MINSITDIVNLHKDRGFIEEGIIKIHIDNKVMPFNIYTLKVRKGNIPKEEVRKWNEIINEEVKKDRNLYKETKEFRSLFLLFEKLKIKIGYIEKSETPDFIYTKNEKTTGIEITKIYVGNEWVAQKLYEDIRAYKLRKNEIEGYVQYKKYQDKIKTVSIRGGIVISPITNDALIDDYIIEIKNKIFEKIRKLIDDYQKFDKNIIFADIVSARYFNSEEEIEKLSKEIKFYINHLDGINDEREYTLILRTTNYWIKFNLQDGIYKKV